MSEYLLDQLYAELRRRRMQPYAPLPGPRNYFESDKDRQENSDVTRQICFTCHRRHEKRGQTGFLRDLGQRFTRDQDSRCQPGFCNPWRSGAMHDGPKRATPLYGLPAMYGPPPLPTFETSSPDDFLNLSPDLTARSYTPPTKPFWWDYQLPSDLGPSSQKIPRHRSPSPQRHAFSRPVGTLPRSGERLPSRYFSRQGL